MCKKKDRRNNSLKNLNFLRYIHKLMVKKLIIIQTFLFIAIIMKYTEIQFAL